MVPRPHHQKHLVVIGIFRLDGFVHGDRAVNVFLIPQAVDEHDRHGQRFLREQLVDCLIAPECVVARVLDHLLPEPELLEAAPPSHLTGRSAAHELVELVGVRAPPLHLVGARRFLVVDVRQPELAERAVVEPVVTHPPVHHRIHGHRHLERRMGMEQRHQREEPVVRDAQDSHLAVALGYVLHQPVDGVERVGGVIDRCRVLRTAQWPVHHVIAFGAVLPANVLDDADVTALDNHVGRIVVAVENRAQMRAFGVTRERRRVVRRPREEDGRAPGAFRQHDHRVQLDAVPHRDHDVALDVLEIVRGRLEVCRCLARQAGVLRRLRPVLGRCPLEAQRDANRRQTPDEAEDKRHGGHKGYEGHKGSALSKMIYTRSSHIRRILEVVIVFHPARASFPM